MIDTEKLRRVANRLGIATAYQLAKAFREKGYSCPDASAQRLWEASNDPKLSTVDRLCDVLGCEISEITSLPSTNGRRRKRSGR